MLLPQKETYGGKIYEVKQSEELQLEGQHRNNKNYGIKGQ